ncbi:MAG TPA: ROK family transcriptional regulator [Streptosporangiaceae bacterium]|nr:ROK family transcriptional regulator [Streptosporangiaceae bacterium]
MSAGVRRRPLRPIGKLLAQDTKRHHRALILQHLFTGGPASRADLARVTGLTRVTVSDLVGRLIDDGLLGELGSPVETKVGKPPTLVGLLADAAHIVALDLSPDDRMTGAVLDLFGQVKGRIDVPRQGASGQAAVRLAVRLAQQLREAADRPLLGVGVGSPGLVDGRGVVLNAPNLGWIDVNLTGILLRELGVPVHVANDANVAVLGEHTFGETAAADLMLVRIGTGVGAGLVVGGALVEGHASAAGEIGHVVVDPAGARCSCGRVGCLETVLAVPHLRRRDRSLASVGTTLGEVLAPVVGALNLSEIVLAGPLDLLEGELREAVEEAVRERLMAALSAELVVRTSPLGDDVVFLGAAVLVLSSELGVS